MVLVLVLGLVTSNFFKIRLVTGILRTSDYNRNNDGHLMFLLFEPLFAILLIFGHFLLNYSLIHFNLTTFQLICDFVRISRRSSKHRFRFLFLLTVNDLLNTH